MLVYCRDVELAIAKSLKHNEPQWRCRTNRGKHHQEQAQSHGVGNRDSRDNQSGQEFSAKVLWYSWQPELEALSKDLTALA